MELPKRNRLAGKSLFLSAGYPTWYHDAYPRAADAAQKIESAVIALARAVFFEGGTLVLGADANITPLIATVLRQYTQPTPAEPLTRPDSDDAPTLVVDFSDPDDRRFLEVVRFVSGGDPHIRFWTPEDDRAVLDGNESVRRDSRRARLMKRQDIVALIVVGGTELTLRDAEQFAKVFDARPVYIYAETGGAARQLFDPQSDRLTAVPEDRYNETLAAFWSERRRPGSVDRPGDPDRPNLRGQRDDLVDRIYTPYNVIAEWLVSHLSDNQRPDHAGYA